MNDTATPYPDVTSPESETPRPRPRIVTAVIIALVCGIVLGVAAAYFLPILPLFFCRC